MEKQFRFNTVIAVTNQVNVQEALLLTDMTALAELFGYMTGDDVFTTSNSHMAYAMYGEKVRASILKQCPSLGLNFTLSPEDIEEREKETVSLVPMKEFAEKTERTEKSSEIQANLLKRFKFQTIATCMCLIAVTVSIGIIWYYHIPLTVTVTGPFGDQFTEFLAGGNIIMCDILICVLTIVFCFWFMSKFSKRSVLDRIYSNRVWLKELKNEIIKVALDIETLKKNQISVESEEASLGSIKKRYAEVEQYLNKLVCQRDEMNACKVKSLFDYWFGPKLNLRITAMLSKIW